MKKAKLVSFDIVVRVLVEDVGNAGLEYAEAIETAIEKVKRGIDNLCWDNVVDVTDDMEVPFNPKEEVT